MIAAAQFLDAEDATVRAAQSDRHRCVRMAADHHRCRRGYRPDPAPRLATRNRFLPRVRVLDPGRRRDRKTALRIVQLLALATARPLTGEHVFMRCRVMLIGLEDGIHELRRRVRAAMRHYGVTPDAVRGWFYIVALPPEGGMLVSQRGDGPLKAWIEQEIGDKRLDLVCFDPLVKLHNLEENDNGAIEQVIGALVAARDRPCHRGRCAAPRRQGSSRSGQCGSRPRRQQLQGWRQAGLHAHGDVG